MRSYKTNLAVLHYIMAVRNFWSLQVGEAVFSDLVKRNLPNYYQVFFPLNSQLRGIDLLLFNRETKKVGTIQVKESREFSAGHGWFIVKASDVEQKTADFYVFIVYKIVSGEHKSGIETKVLIVPSSDLIEKSRGKQLVNIKKKPEYHYYFFIDGNKAMDNRENREVDFTKFLDNYEPLKI